MPDLRFYFLGPLEIRSDGRLLLKPPTLKSQSLLAYLVLHHTQVQPREKLAGLFWGDRTEHKARRSLATALWHIRSCLGDESFLLSDHTSLQINPEKSFWLDVEQFETLAKKRDACSLEAAINLYRGMLLEGFYDDWIINQRYGLEGLYFETLARLMAAQEASGASAEALATALSLVESDPFREEAYRTAMRAYCGLGQRAAALELFHRAEKTLEEELGASLVEETRDLYQAILAGQVTIGPVQDVPLISPPQLRSRMRGQDPLETGSTGPLVGRDEELAQLVQTWQATLAGENCLVLIEGEAGIGKTRLVEAFAVQVHQRGGWILPGRCYAFERLLSYQPIIEALSSLQNLLGEPDWQRFPGWVLAEVGRLIPDIPSGNPEASESASEEAEDEQERLFDGLSRFIRQLASQRPVLIVLEDLHWASESSLSLLHFLVRHLQGQPVLLLATFRPHSSQPAPALKQLLRQLVKEGYTRSITLKPLSEEAVVALVQSLSGIEQEITPLASRLFRETEGNPFFLTEIIKSLFDSRLLRLEKSVWQGDFLQLADGQIPLPGSLGETILSRVERLEEAAQKALRMAVVLGREFDFEPLSRLYGQGDEAAASALDSLLRGRLIEEGSGVMGRDYAFSHHKIQEVVYAQLSRRVRQQVHIRAGEALEGSYRVVDGVLDQSLPNDPGVVLPAELAYHFEQGRKLDTNLNAKAAYYLLAAGDQARHLYAHQEAIQFYRQALSILEECGEYEQIARTLMKLGLVYHNAFDFDLARQTYQEAFSYWQQAENVPAPGFQSLTPPPHALHMLAEEPATLDTTRHPNDRSIVVLEALFSGLVQQGPRMEILPDLAQDWDLLEGGRGYIFNLRREARWTDGQPVRAADFVAAWRRLLDPANLWETPATLYDIRGAKAVHLRQAQPDELGVIALDDTTLLVELSDPCGHFLNLMATSAAYPLPSHQLARFGEAWCQPEHLVTNGPFRLVSWQRGKTIHLARNPDYHNKPGGNVQEVELHFVKPWSGGLQMYADGQLDVLDISFFQPRDLEVTRQLYLNDYRLTPRLATGFTAFDTSNPPFDDQRVRRAFALAIDRQSLATSMRGDQVLPASGGFVPPGMAGHTPGIALPFDPPQARRLLAEAGYPGGRGFPEVISIVPQVTASHVVGKFIAEQWLETLNVQIHGQARPLGQFHITDEAQRSHLFSYAFAASYADPAEFLQFSDPLLHTHWRDQNYEFLVEQARQCLNQERRMAIYAQAERILATAAPLIPLFYLRWHLLVKPWVQSFAGSGGAGSAWKDIILQPHP